MKMIDLFAGIGGFSLAGHRMGWETVAFVEKERFPQQVLRKNFPGVPIYGDIYEFREKEINEVMGLTKTKKYDDEAKNNEAEPTEGIDIVTGGFP